MTKTRKKNIAELDDLPLRKESRKLLSKTNKNIAYKYKGYDFG